jgi:hypothetical protein
LSYQNGRALLRRITDGLGWNIVLRPLFSLQQGQESGMAFDNNLVGVPRLSVLAHSTMVGYWAVLGYWSAVGVLWPVSIFAASGWSQSVARDQALTDSSGQQGAIGSSDPKGERSVEWERLRVVLEECSPVTSELWDDANCRTLHQGAYLGNGDLGAQLGGTRHKLVWYLGKNGFHAGNNPAGADGDGIWTQHILNLAVLTIEKSTGEDSGELYEVVQDLADSEVRIRNRFAGTEVQTRSWLDPIENSLVIEFSAPGEQAVPLVAELQVLGNKYVAKSAGISDGVAWVSKEPNPVGAPFYVKGAVAARIVNADSELSSNGADRSRLSFTLPRGGERVRLYVRAEHLKDAGSPLADVQAAAAKASLESCLESEAANRAWWREWWLRGYIQLEDDVQKYWYNHLYLIGSAARSGRDNGPGKAPGHWGPWNRRDDMMWFSNVSMNYNGQNPYYGVFAANRVNLIDPYIETVKFYSENTGRRRVANRTVSPTIASRMPKNCRGTAFELSFTSHGTSCGEGAWVDQDGSMPTNAIFGLLPIVWKWKYGQDKAFLAETCYPLMRDVIDFFDDYIGPPVNGQYEVYGAVHEGRDWFAANDMFSLGAVRFLYRETLAASIVLDRDEERRAHWQDVLDRLPPYHLQAWGKSVTFRPDANHDVMEALSYQGGARNTGLMFTTTFDNIGYDSLPAYRIATCRTLDKGNMFFPQRFSGWQDSNDFGMMFVMAVRAGYRAERVIKAIKDWKPGPNGIVSQNQGGGIETAGIVEAINNMLLQSHDGVIRLFPNWDYAQDAEFVRMRTVGAFLVSAKYRSATGAVESVTIASEAGNRCELQSPYPGQELIVRDLATGLAVETEQLGDERVAFATEPGAVYQLGSQPRGALPVGTPVIKRHPESASVELPAAASFTVEATGADLHFQWQKNRQNIVGAQEPTYTTPPTTLWDLGSEYRCVVSSREGITVSRAAVLNPEAAAGKLVERD